MAVYKVIQDIEAEDKLLGPLTLRQFVYAGITVFFLYLCYLAISKSAAFMLVVFLPPALLTGFFAFPWGREQPTEVWALARVRFLFKPRKRIWNQSGIKELVTITAPKKVEQVYTDGLSQTEVKSRLKALAATIDSRGWAIKSAAMSPYVTPVVANVSSSERLIDPNILPRDVSVDDTTTYDDMLDTENNPKAQEFDAMLQQNAQAQRARLIESMQQPSASNPQTQPTAQTAPTGDYWFLNQPQQTSIPSSQTTFGTQTITTQTDPESSTTSDPILQTEEQALIDQLRSRQEDQSIQYSHLPKILPLSEQEKLAKQAAQQATVIKKPEKTELPSVSTTDSPQVTAQPDTAILELAKNDDLNIATIARQAKKAHGEEPDEVVISLH